MNDDKLNRALVESEQKLTIMTFTSSWSGGSQLAQFNLEDLEDEGLPFSTIYVDVKKEGKTAQRFNVFSVPTYIVFYEREILERFSGVVPKHILRQKINTLLRDNVNKG